MQLFGLFVCLLVIAAWVMVAPRINQRLLPDCPHCNQPLGVLGAANHRYIWWWTWPYRRFHCGPCQQTFKFDRSSFVGKRPILVMLAWATGVIILVKIAESSENPGIVVIGGFAVLTVSVVAIGAVVMGLKPKLIPA